MQPMTKNLKRLFGVVIGIGAAACVLFMAMPNQSHLNHELLRAVGHKDIRWATDLLKRGASVDTKDNDPVANTLFQLLNHGHTESGYTVLMIACVEDNVPLVQLLLENGASVDMKDDNGSTALMFSA